MAAPAFVAADKSWLQIADASQSGLDPGTSDFSIALFVRPDSLSSMHYLWHKQVPGNNPGYNCYLNTNGSISVVFGDSVGHATSGTSAAGVIVAGSWHSIVVTFDRDGNAIVYVNGVSVLMLDISAYTGNCNNSEAFLLATRPSAGFPFAGRLSHLRVWSRLLTPAEIARQANIADGLPHARPYSSLNAAEKVGLVSAWDIVGPFNQLQVMGTLSPDATGSYTVAGVYGGYPYWTNGTYFIWYWSAVSGWVITSDLGSGSDRWQSNIYLENDYVPVAGCIGTATVSGVQSSGIYPTTFVDSKIGWKDLHGTNHLSFTASPIISPTVNNGGFETAGTGEGIDVFGSWLEGATPPTTINSEASDVHAGSSACRFDVDAKNKVGYVAQSCVSLGKRYSYSIYAKKSLGGAPFLRVGSKPFVSLPALSTSYAEYAGVLTADGVYIFITFADAEYQSIYLDDVTLTAAEILTADGPAEVAAVMRWLPRRHCILGGGLR